MKYSLLSLLLILPFLANSQSVDTAQVPVWIDMMQDPDANFYETQRAFERYWEDRERSRGDGWKIFKRWEWFWGQRIDENGNLPAPDATINAYTEWEIAYNQSMQGTESVNGDWEEVGPRFKPQNGTGQPNGNGRLNYIAFHPTDTNVMYVGSPSGGFWKTDNYGSSWQTTTDGLPTLGVSSILVNYNNPDIIYIGTGDRDANDAPGLGVYKSLDGGETWFVSNTGMGNRSVGQMLMHPTNPDHILAATSGGVYRSTNGGSSWTQESPNANFKDMRYKPGSADTVYATETSSGANFWRSTDGGDSWTMITAGLPSSAQRYAIAVTEDNPEVVYLLRSISSAYGGVFKSTNGGTSFTTQSTTPNLLTWNENPPATGGGGQGWYDLCIAADPNDENVVYVGGVNIHKSTDGGVTWDCAAHWVGSATAASVHADHHWFEYSPLDGRLYNCNDGGLYYTEDGGTTWPEISDSLGIAQIYRIGVSANTNELVFNGYQDNGSALWDANIFRTERGGDGMECIIDPSNDDIMYASVYFGNIARSFDNGVSFGGFANTNVISESGAWVTPYIVDPSNPQTMYIGYKNVWRTTDAYAGSPTFEAISNSLAGSNNTNMRQLRLAKLNANQLYAVRSDNRLFRSDNVQAATPTWTDLTGFLPGGAHIADVETSPFDSNTVWIIRSNQVYASANNGTSWTNITGNLPGVSKNCMVADPYSAGGLYIGTDVGIYYTDDSLSNWIPFNDGFPSSAEVTELEIYHEAGNWTGSRLRAATYGRGLWESDLYDPGTNQPLAFMDISMDSTDICTPDTITLSNNSAYGVDSLHWTITPAANVSFVNGTNANSSIAQVVMNDIGSYDVSLYVENVNGSDSVTILDAIEVSGGISLPFYEDFEDNNPCSTGGCETFCNSYDWVNISNTIDDTDWRTDFGGTPSGGTGPSVDFDPGTSTGNYMYIESSWCLLQEAYLESPCISLDQLNAPEIKFAYHREGWAAWMQSLELEILSNGTWTNINTITGVQGSAWQLDSIDLSAYVGENVKLRFIGTTGAEWQADMAIDGISLTAAPEADFTANDTTPCIGQSVGLMDASTQSPTSWTWTITPNTFNYVAGSNAGSQNPQVAFNANGVYTVTLQAGNAYGNDNTTKTSYIVVDNPDATLASTALNNTYCPEDTAFVYAPAGMDFYHFKRNNILFQQGYEDTAMIVAPQDGDLIEVTVTDSQGCMSTDTLTLHLHDSPTSVLTSSESDLEICDGDTVVFTNNGNLIVQHGFLLQGVLQQEDSVNTWTTDQLIDGDSIVVEIVDENGCEGYSNGLTMTVLPLPPTPTIQLIMDSLQCMFPADLYRWYHDDTTAIIANNRFPKQGDGNYRVRIFEGGCWSDWSDPFIIAGLEGEAYFTMRAYPSPARDVLNLRMTNVPVSGDATFTVYDMQGKQLLMEEHFIGNQTELSLNIAHLSAGVYHLSVQRGDERIGISFIKEIR